MLTPPIIHDLIHRTLGLDHPHTHWWIDLVTVLVLVVAPAWTAWLAIRSGLRWAAARRHRTRGTAALPPPAASLDAAGRPGARPAVAARLESYVVRATSRLQFRLVLLSVLTLPAAWLLLEIPKHIIN
ncbi:multidrug ABC transporter ATPase, partial [Methylorubrum rhodesianum]